MPRADKRDDLSAFAVEAAVSDVKPWELHSELVFVCPEVWKRALELLPERDPDAFLRRPPQVASGEPSGSLPTAVVGYALLRLLETASCGLVAVGAVVALALLADAFH
jgi:hypothetical protein